MFLSKIFSCTLFCLGFSALSYAEVQVIDVVDYFGNNTLRAGLSLNMISTDANKVAGFGLYYEHVNPKKPFGFELGVISESSSDSDSGASIPDPYAAAIDIYELNIGIKKYFARTDRFGPYGSIGIAQAEIDYDAAGYAGGSSSDTGIGPYGELGFLYFGYSVTWGIAVRMSFIDVDLSPYDVDGYSSRIIFSLGGSF